MSRWRLRECGRGCGGGFGGGYIERSLYLTWRLLLKTVPLIRLRYVARYVNYLHRVVL